MALGAWERTFVGKLLGKSEGVSESTELGTVLGIEEGESDAAVGEAEGLSDCF